MSHYLTIEITLNEHFDQSPTEDIHSFAKKPRDEYHVANLQEFSSAQGDTADSLAFDVYLCEENKDFAKKVGNATRLHIYMRVFLPSGWGASQSFQLSVVFLGHCISIQYISWPD